MHREVPQLFRVAQPVCEVGPETVTEAPGGCGCLAEAGRLQGAVEGSVQVRAAIAGGRRGQPSWGRDCGACGGTAACECDRSRSRKVRGRLGQGMAGVTHGGHDANLAPEVTWDSLESAF